MAPGSEPELIANVGTLIVVGPPRGAEDILPAKVSASSGDKPDIVAFNFCSLMFSLARVQSVPANM